MANQNFVNYSDASQIVSKIASRLNAIQGAYVFRGSVAFAGLPSTLASSMVGYVYNVNEDFVTDARFIEGAGKAYAAGTNVAVTDVSTTAYNAVTPLGTENPSEEGWYEQSGTDYVPTTDTTVDGSKTYYEKVVTPAYAFDTLASFVDVEEIEDRITDTQKMIEPDAFSAASAYVEKDIVRYQDKLYRFKAAGHTAGDPWDPTEVDEVNVVGLIAEVSGGSGDLKDRFEEFEAAVVPVFDDTQAYSIGDVVTYSDSIFKFKAAHTANDPWDATEVDQIVVVSYLEGLIDAVDGRVDTVVGELAPAFDPVAGVYAVGDLVIKDDVLYRFTAAHTAGAWDPAEVETVDLGTVIGELEGASDDLADRIDVIAADLADIFDETQAYSAGTLIVYQDALYKFVADHTANDPWDASEVTAVTVEGVIDALETRVDTLKANVADAFLASENYETGDVVLYGDGLYRFTADHAAGAWAPADVEAVTIETLIDDAEPESLTTEQINTLLALID